MGLLDQLEVYYNCDEAGGNRADSVGSLDLPPSAPTPAVAGIINNAVDFASGGTFLSLASAPAFVYGDEPLTINAWLQINAGTTLNNQGKISKHTGVTEEYQIRYRASGFNRWEFVVRNGGAPVLVRADNFGAVPIDTLFMVTAIHDPVANTISIRVNDGTPDVIAHATGINAGTFPFNIGTSPQGNSIGAVDEVGLWRRVLAGSEITQLFGGGVGFPFSSFTTDVVPPGPPPTVLTERAGFQERPGNLFLSQPVAAGEFIFDGALVAIDPTTGRIINWRDATAQANFFLGIAEVTDETGIAAFNGEAVLGNAGGTQVVDIRASGTIIVEIPVAGAAVGDVGNLVFASDENTFSTIATPGGNPVGSIARVENAGVADIKLFSADDYRAHRGT